MHLLDTRFLNAKRTARIFQRGSLDRWGTYNSATPVLVTPHASAYFRMAYTSSASGGVHGRTTVIDGSGLFSVCLVYKSDGVTNLVVLDGTDGSPAITLSPTGVAGAGTVTALPDGWFLWRYDASAAFSLASFTLALGSPLYYSAGVVGRYVDIASIQVY